MAAPLATCTKEEQLSVIHFFYNEGMKPIEVNRQMIVQCADVCLSLQKVYEWTRKFMNGTGSVKRSPRRGQAHPVMTPQAIAAVEAIMKENHHIAVN